MRDTHERSGLPFNPKACKELVMRHMSNHDRDLLINIIKIKHATGLVIESDETIHTLCVRYLRASNR